MLYRQALAHTIYYMVGRGQLVTAHLKMSMLPSTVYLRQNVHVTSLLLTFGCDSSSLPMLLNDFTSPANGPEPRSSRTINKLYASAVHR